MITERYRINFNLMKKLSNLNPNKYLLRLGPSGIKRRFKAEESCKSPTMEDPGFI